MHDILIRIPSLRKPLGQSVMRSALFAGLLAAAAMSGAIPLPGTPVPITLQTFVVMLAGLMLPWREAAGSIILYLGSGAAGLPVFAGGGSAASFVGPSGGFLIGFLPAAVVTAIVASSLRRRTEAIGAPVARFFALMAANLTAAISGCIIVLYALGIGVQSAVTSLSPGIVAMSTASFILVDLLKATVACAAVSGISMAAARRNPSSAKD
ncbi:biotin transporter BioY [uncultured Bifidobacterium sp.]|uniref:biotin transporter BioY n=1 Tax=uncultured Bifidobacterium sp. TaxID=165187 RepID=UPI00262DC02B|nr:biotin transporter BioY [uncultured Bifidobacterium sp.]